MLKDFKKFLLRGNVVDLAVAVLVGAAFNTLVSSFVKDLINPLIALMTGHSNVNFSNYSFTIHGAVFNYGSFLNSIISFVIIAVVVFFFVVQPINKLISLANLGPEKEDKKCPQCLSLIPIKAKRCKFCTSKLN